MAVNVEKISEAAEKALRLISEESGSDDPWDQLAFNLAVLSRVIGTILVVSEARNMGSVGRLRRIFNVGVNQTIGDVRRLERGESIATH